MQPLPFPLIPPAQAHQIETAGTVGATLHLEPNDTPKAGETTHAWFNLARQGGEAIPLPQCQCHLSIYTQPRSPSAQPILTPALSPAEAEGYQGLPIAHWVFPSPGSYELELVGKAIAPGTFPPFTLTFEVVVAQGQSIAGSRSPDAILVQELTPSTPVSLEWGILSGAIVLLLGLGLYWVRQRDKG